ncbi:hypothetical protein Aca07nite_88320 [Actinoplanes capillaceus]|uniref:Carrier domain-containing protein n=1 Tax=Actinoplanes campanulatus TaxID=113559 RepID=A0ABQ3WZB8_9ACTN|nr:non-ribosomal peptide synthetase [Actinoplanes capillaceus]GID51557.1 hypothetical protein Aca07nite_88320 [Actinoplanes capillaceus]
MTGHHDVAADHLREAVTGIWCAVLGADHAGPEDDFFAEGGDSALAVEAALSLRAVTGTDLEIDILYQYPRFGRLLSYLTDPRPEREERPLTPAEELLWFVERRRPGTPVYHIAALYRFPGRIDIPRLRTALDALVAGHAALRRGFEAPGRAVTAARATVSCRWLDGRGLPAGTLRELIDEHARLPFDLARPPLLRAVAVERGDEGDLLLLTVHHLVCDGGSLAILEDALSELYTNGGAGPAPGPAAIPEGARAVNEESRAYWRRVLADCPRTIALPHDLSRPATLDNAGDVHRLVCPGDLVADMARFAARERVSPFMTWIVAYVAGLVAQTGERDVVIGIAASSRTAEQRGEIGMFVDPVPLRLAIPDGTTARDLARQVRSATTAALAHRGVPFPTIVDDLGPGGDPSRAPLVQAGLSYLDVAAGALRFDGQQAVRDLLPTGTAKYELLWSVTRQADRTITELEHLSGLFTTERAGQLHAAMIAAAGAAFANPDAPLRLPERPIHAGRRPLPELIRLRAGQRPHAPAIRDHGVELTYAQLDERAVAIATGLRAAGLRRGDVVAVPMARGADAICCYLGIFYAGCAYLPVDQGQPARRLRAALDGVADAALVTASSPPLPGGLRVLRLDRLLDDPDRVADPAVPVRVTGDDAAYLMSTSGTTGRPKTVVVPHRAISRLVPDAAGLEYRRDDRVAHLCNPAFDAAVLEIWGALGTGAVLAIGNREDVSSPARLRAFLDEHRISVLGLPTALLNTVIDFAPDALGELRLLIFGGEKADEQRLARLLAHRPPASVVNVYGPTENTTVSTLQQVTAAGLDPGPLPIGRPVSGSTAYALGPDGEPVPPGAEGELYVGGDGLARGYHGNPALTAASFVPNPFGPGRLYRTGDRVRMLPDGTFFFRGRTDDQVKVRGYRVELAEIEHALRSLPGVDDAVVAARATSDSAELLAWVTGARDAAGLTEDLRTRLPAYMIPAVAVADRLPLNANGKVDRAALLASLDAPGTAAEAPGDDPADDSVTEAVAALWRESLGLARVRPDDSFVALGGHSIKALRLLARLDEELGVTVDLADFLADPTMRALVAAVHHLQPTTERKQP